MLAHPTPDQGKNHDDHATCVSPYPPASKSNKKKRKGSARLDDAMHSDAATDSECDSSSDEDSDSDDVRGDFCLDDLIDSDTD